MCRENILPLRSAVNVLRKLKKEGEGQRRLRKENEEKGRVLNCSYASATLRAGVALGGRPCIASLATPRTCSFLKLHHNQAPLSKGPPKYRAYGRHVMCSPMHARVLAHTLARDRVHADRTLGVNKRSGFSGGFIPRCQHLSALF